MLHSVRILQMTIYTTIFLGEIVKLCTSFFTKLYLDLSSSLHSTLSHACRISCSYIFPPSMSIPNHIFIYSSYLPLWPLSTSSLGNLFANFLLFLFRLSFLRSSHYLFSQHGQTISIYFLLYSRLRSFLLT